MSRPLVFLLVAVPPAVAEAASRDLRPAASISLQHVSTAAAALDAVAAGRIDAVVIDVEAEPAAAASLSALAASAAVVVLAGPHPARAEAVPDTPERQPGHAEDGHETDAVAPPASATADDGLLAALRSWTRLGAEDVVWGADTRPGDWMLRTCLAVERRHIELASRRAYATDLATGLPHRQQLLEHMSQLLALREREPAPMALVVLRIEGFATTESRLGATAANHLRRKIGVRLRAAVRASDVVAVLDELSYAVLLGALLAPDDAGRVATKLAQALMEPFSVGGMAVAVAVAVGLGAFPADGSDADGLLRRAVESALDASAQGRVGMANFVESGTTPFEAANDD